MSFSPTFRARLAMVTVTVMALAGCRAFAPGFAEFGGERVRDMRDRAAQRDAVLELRLDLLLPELLAQAEIDCWLVLTDGAYGDPMAQWLTLSETRPEGRGALLLCGGDTGPRRFALGHGFDANRAIFEVAAPGDGETLATLLNERLAEIDPQRIAINDAPAFAAADGLSASNARWLGAHLAAPYADRLTSSRALAEDFLATILDVEVPLIGESARLTALILEEVLSDRVTIAARTSLADLEAAVRQRAASVHVELAFPPRPLVYRPGASLEAERELGLDIILQPGDLVFLSAGIRYLGYATRVGRWAYMPVDGESVAPDWVIEAVNTAADGAEAAATALALGQGYDQAMAAVSNAAVGARAAVDRLGRLAEGNPDAAPATAASGPWRPQYRIADGVALGLILERSVIPETAAARAFGWPTVDTVVVTAAGAAFAIAPQRLPLLIG